MGLPGQESEPGPLDPVILMPGILDPTCPWSHPHPCQHAQCQAGQSRFPCLHSSLWPKGLFLGPTHKSHCCGPLMWKQACPLLSWHPGARLP